LNVTSPVLTHASVHSRT